MNVFLLILGLIITAVVSVGIPTLLLTYGFSLPWLKALAVTFAFGFIAQGARK